MLCLGTPLPAATKSTGAGGPPTHPGQRLLAGQPVQEGEAGAAGDEILGRLAVLVVHCARGGGGGLGVAAVSREVQCPQPNADARSIWHLPRPNGTQGASPAAVPSSSSPHKPGAAAPHPPA